MNNNGNNVNPDKIIEDLTKMPSTGKLCIIFGSICLGLAAIGGILLLMGNDGLAGPMLLIIGLAFAPLFFIIVLAKKIKSSKRLKNVDLNVLKSELQYGVSAYEGLKTYFTQNYVLSNYYYAFVVRYSDIAWIYRLDKANQNGTVISSDLMICLRNGKKECTFYSEQFLHEIYDRNPQILVGYNSDNKKRYKEIVNTCKNGVDSNYRPADIPREPQMMNPGMQNYQGNPNNYQGYPQNNGQYNNQGYPQNNYNQMPQQQMQNNMYNNYGQPNNPYQGQNNNQGNQPNNYM